MSNLDIPYIISLGSIFIEDEILAYKLMEAAYINYPAGGLPDSLFIELEQQLRTLE